MNIHEVLLIAVTVLAAILGGWFGYQVGYQRGTRGPDDDYRHLGPPI